MSSSKIVLTLRPMVLENLQSLDLGHGHLHGHHFLEVLGRTLHESTAETFCSAGEDVYVHEKW